MYNILVIDYRDISHPEAGGAEVLVHEIFGRLANRGHRITLLCSGYKGGKLKEYIGGMRILRVGNQHNFNFVVPYVYRRRLSKNSYDAIVEDINKIPFFMPLFSNTCVLPVLPHIFGATLFKQAPFPLALYVYSYEKLIPFIYRNCKISVLSQSTKEDLIERGLPEENLQVIHPGVDRILYNTGDGVAKDSSPIILYVGRIKQYKCIDHVIRAMPRILHRVPDAQYLVAGTGDYLDSLRRLTSKLDLDDNVKFLGYISHDKKADLMRRANLLVYTSPKEGWGLSVIEANACGTCAVASRSPGLKDAVVDKETGFLVEHGDIEALGEAIVKVLSNDALRGRLSRNAHAWSQNFSWERAADETLELIEQAIEGTDS